MVHYVLGYCHSRKGDTVKALEYYKKAEQDDHSYCFPNRIEEVLVLQDAMKENHEACAKAAYALGNFWYAARQYDNAIACWEASAAIDPAFPTVWRNLSLAYYNKRNDPQKAVETLEKAYRLDESDARILMELTSSTNGSDVRKRNVSHSSNPIRPKRKAATTCPSGASRSTTN